MNYDLENLSLGLSLDHTPLVLDLQTQGTHTLLRQPLKHIGWASFQKDVNNINFSPRKKTSLNLVDQAIKEFTNSITVLLEKTTLTTPVCDQKRNLLWNILNEIRKKTKTKENLATLPQSWCQNKAEPTIIISQRTNAIPRRQWMDQLHRKYGRYCRRVVQDLQT